MFISGHLHVLAIRKPHFQCNANRKVATASAGFCNEPHPLHVLFVNVASGTTITSCSKHHFVVIGKAEQQVCKASHCGTKQQWRFHVVLILLLLVRATWVLFFTHIPLVVNRTFTTTLRGYNTCSKVGLDFLNDWEWKRQAQCKLRKLRYK